MGQIVCNDLDRSCTNGSLLHSAGMWCLCCWSCKATEYLSKFSIIYGYSYSTALLWRNWQKRPISKSYKINKVPPFFFHLDFADFLSGKKMTVCCIWDDHIYMSAVTVWEWIASKKTPPFSLWWVVTSFSIRDQRWAHQTNWMLCICLHDQRHLASRPMLQTKFWSLPLLLHVATQAPELEPPVLFSCGNCWLVQGQPLPLWSPCWMQQSTSLSTTWQKLGHRLHHCRGWQLTRKQISHETSVERYSSNTCVLTCSSSGNNQEPLLGTCLEQYPAATKHL